MGKLRRFLGLFVFFATLTFASNSFAEGYTCPDLKMYISCSEDKRLTEVGVAENSCVDCPGHSSADADNATIYCNCDTGYNASGSSQTSGADCVANTYTVKYDANGGSGTTADSTHTYGVSKALTANGFTNGTKQFLGWSTSSGATTATYSNKQEVTNLTSTYNGTVTLFAVWGDCQACEPGTGATCELSAPNGACTYDTDCLPGYENIQNDGEYNPSCSACSYTIAYNKNGGSGEMSDTSATYDSAVALRKNEFTRDGWTFLGWSTDPNATEAEYEDQASVTNLINVCGGLTKTLYAVWGANCLEISIEPNGGTAGTTTSIYKYAGLSSTFYSDPFCTKPISSISGLPTRDGYSFTGLYNYPYPSLQYFDANGVPTDQATAWIISSNQKLYAVWEECTYTVKYDSNKPSTASASITGTTADSTHTYDSSKALTSNGYSLTGWTFAGWNTKSDGSGTSYANGASVKNLTSTCDDSVTLFAQWTANQFTVTFDKNDGTGTANPTSKTCTYDSDCTAATQGTLSRSEYTFQGWSESSTATSAQYSAGDDITNISTGSNITLYAVWSKCATCSTTNGSCSVSVSNNACVYVHTCSTGFYNTNHGKSVSSSSLTCSACSNKPANSSYTSAATSNSCEWECSPCNKGTDASSCSVQKTANACVYSGTCVEGSFNPKVSGTTVSCSTCPDNSTASDGNDATYCSCITNYNANGATTTTSTDCVPNVYDIKYELDGGTNYSGAPTTYTYGVGATIDGVPTKSGYTFQGWCTSSAKTSCNYTQSILATATGTKTYYAKWGACSCVKGNNVNSCDYAETSTENECVYSYICNSGYKSSGTFSGQAGVASSTSPDCSACNYTVEFEENGGTGTMANQTFTFDKETELNKNSFVKTGYSFAGWALTSTGSVEYADGESVTNLGDDCGDVVTLYAQWTPCPYTVKYDSNKPSAATTTMSGSTADSTHTYDTDQALTSNGYSLSGWKFLGWALSATGSVAYDDGESVKNLTSTCDGSVTLFAQWEQTFVNCEAGKYWNASSGKMLDCPSGSYCEGTGSTDVLTNGCLAGCPTGFTSRTGEAIQDTDCYKTCSAGQYWDGSNCVDAEDKYYGFSQTTEVKYKTAAYGHYECPEGVSGSDSGRDADTDCFTNCPAWTGDLPSNATGITATPTKVYYDGKSSYLTSTCGFNVTCNGAEGYEPVASTQGTTAPRCEFTSDCPDGYYCPGDGEKYACPEDKYGNQGHTDTANGGATVITQCYHIYDPWEDFGTDPETGDPIGLAKATCFYESVDKDYTNCNVDQVYNCAAGRYELNKSCVVVDSGYYSPAPTSPESTTVDENSKKKIECPTGWYRSESKAESYTQCYKECNDTILHGTATAVKAEVNAKNADAYNACEYTVSCDGGYSDPAEGSATTSPVCNAKVYDIIFDANGGSGSVASVSCTFDGKCAALPANTFTRTGYSPATKWCKDTAGTACFNVGDVISENLSSTGDDVTLFATWTPEVYKITLNKNAPTATDGAPTTVYLKYATGWYKDASAGTSISELTTWPTNGTYTFGGFKSDANVQVVSSTGEFLTSQEALTFTASDATVNAIWGEGSITCQAGTYYDGFGGATSDCLPCKQNYWCPGGTFTNDIGTESGLNRCPDDGLTDGTGKSLESQCYKDGLDYKADYGSGTQSCYYKVSSKVYEDACFNKKIDACNAGYWLEKTSNTDCSVVDYNYYSKEGDTDRTECPDNGFTTGQTSGAVGECQLVVDTYKNTYSQGNHTCYYNENSTKTGVARYESKCHSPEITWCAGGYYDSGVYADATKPDCVAVGKGRYSPIGDVKGHDCPAYGEYKVTTQSEATAEKKDCFIEGLLYPADGWEADRGITVHGSGSQTCSLNPDTDRYTRNCLNVTILACDGGYYYDAEKSATACNNAADCKVCSAVESGYYSPDGATDLKTCPPGATGSDSGRDADTDCFTNCPAWTGDLPSNATGITATPTKVYYDGKSSYLTSTCGFNVTCNGAEGYEPVASTQGTTAPRCEFTSDCPDGYYCPGDGEKYACPEDKYGNQGHTDTANGGATVITQCYHIYDPWEDFGTDPETGDPIGLAKATCFYESVDKDYTNCNVDQVYNCAAGRYELNKSCVVVDSGYYSPAPTSPESTTVDENSKKKIECPTGWYRSESKAESYTQCYKECNDTILHGTATAVKAEVNAKNADAYNACEYTVSCDGGYSDPAEGSATTSPVCNAKVYDIIFDANGGSGSVASVSCTFDGKCAALPANTFTRTGYSPATKWCKDTAGTACFNVGDVISENLSSTGDDVTLFATWTPEVYKITLNKNAPTATDGAPTTVYLKYATGWYKDASAGTSISELTTWPTNGTYTFGGFKSDANVQVVSSTGEFLTSQEALTFTASDATVNAIWGEGSITCQAGTYYDGFGGATSDCLPCKQNYWCPGGTFTNDIGTESGLNRCPDDGLTDGTGKSLESQCYKDGLDYKADYGSGTQSCYYKVSSKVYEDACFNKKIDACNAGYWLEKTSNTDCSVVDYNYYSKEGDTDRTECPDNGFTTGQTSGAVGECQLVVDTYKNTYSQGNHTCYYNENSTKTGVARYESKCHSPEITWCAGGYYDSGVYADATKPDCVAVGKGRYSPIGDVKGHDCPAYGEYKVTTQSEATAEKKDCFIEGLLYPADGWEADRGITVHGSGSQTCSLNPDTDRYTRNCLNVTILACDGGYYYDAEKSATACNNAADCKVCSAVESGYYSPDGATDLKTCPPGADGSNNGRDANTDCYDTCPTSVTPPENATAIEPTNDNVYYNGSAYPTCTYTVTCDTGAGYAPVDQDTANPTCQMADPTKCPEDHYCPGDGKVYPCPEDDAGNKGRSPAGTTSVTECYIVYSPYSGFQYGSASATCHYNIVAVPNGYTECTTKTVFYCEGGHHYKGGMLCDPVDPKYYSPAPKNPEATTTVDSDSIVQTECPAGVFKSEEYAESYTQCQAKCETTVVNATSVNPVHEFVNGASATTYEACLYNVLCRDGYAAEGNGTTNPTCVAKVYNINFDANGGKGETESVSCTFDGKCEALPVSTFTRTGYSQGTKWCKDKAGTTCFDVGDVISENLSSTGDDVTLYATWTPNVYKITLDKNASTAANGTPTTVYLKYATGWYKDANANTQISKLDNNPINMGYEFAGFYTEPVSSDGVQVIDMSGNLLASMLTFTAQDTTIYAGWGKGAITCPAGTYYDGTGGNPDVDCAVCEENSYCQGGSFAVDTGVQGQNACPDNGLTFGGGKASADDCYQTKLDYNATNGSGTQSCYYDSQKQTYYSGNCFDKVIDACKPGYWLEDPSSDIDCVAVEDGYYSADKEIVRTACPEGGFTGIKTASKVSECQLRVDTYQAVYATGTQICYYNPDSQKEGKYKYDAEVCHSKVVDWCRGGYYFDADLTNAEKPDCVPVGVAYYSNSGDVERHECPLGGTTKDDTTVFVDACFLTGLEFPPADWSGIDIHGKGTRTCYYNQTTNAYTYNCEKVDMLMCDGGYYFDKTLSDTACAGTSSCAACVEVGYNYYSPAPVNPDELVADAPSRERVMCPLDSTTEGTYGTDIKTASSASECYKEGVKCSVSNGTGRNKCYLAIDGTYTRDCTTCITESCGEGYYKDNGVCVECPEGMVCTGPEGPESCSDLTGGKYPLSDAGAGSVDYCYAECAVVQNANSMSGKDYYGANVADTCKIATCVAGFKPNATHTMCVECAEGEVCDPEKYPDGATCETLTNGRYPYSDKGTGDIADCYADCSVAENAQEMTGRDYYQSADTCAVMTCKPGFKKDASGKCVVCPAGEVCDPDIPGGSATCSTLTGGTHPKSDKGVSDKAYCYTDCKATGNATAVSGRDYYSAQDTCQIDDCADGYYLQGGVCVECPEDMYCDDPLEEPKSCPASHPKSDGKAGSKNDCYTICEPYDIEGGTAVPKKEHAFYPAMCEYHGISDDGNPCEIIDGVCVITACKSTHEMINGKCVPCNRENALTYLPEGNCRVELCVSGYHPNVDRCEEDIIDCEAPHAVVARQTWDSKLKSYGVCMIEECEDGYHVASNACVVDVQDCVVENGVGLKEWNHSTDAWGECIATRCEPGYTMDPSLTNERTKQCGQCKNKFSVLGEIAASSYVSECEIASCMYQGEKYNLENNECHPICDINGYEDETGTMKWDSSRKKCIRTCKEGYTSW